MRNSNYLSQNDIRMLLNSISSARDHLIVRTLYETGCTLEQLVKIKVSDVQGDKILVQGRFVQISGGLRKALAQYIIGNRLKKEQFLISARQTGHISEKRVRQLIHKYGKANNMPMGPKTLRYYHVIHAYHSGVYLENIAAQLDITLQRVFQIIEMFGVKPQNHYNYFLKRVI